MSQFLKDYLMSIVAVSLLVAVVTAVIRQDTARRIVSMMGGLLIVITTVSPLLKIDGDAVSRAIWKMQLDTESVSNGVELGSKALMRQVISDRCTTYILDKAENLGLVLQVEVKLEENDQVPYPAEVTVHGRWSPAEQRILSDYIYEQLGIPPQRQEWVLS